MTFLFILIVIIILYFIINFLKENQKNEIETKNNTTTYKNDKINNSNKSIILFRNSIPPYRRKLLYISDKSPEDIHVGFGGVLTINIEIERDNISVSSIEETESDEPSTIFFRLPIRIPSNNVEIEKLGYYPSYASMNPYQRYIYLNWLTHPEQKIDIGYVFVYYYGLERQLMTGNFEEAFNEILFLRKYHQNNSFINYSNVALTHACLVRGKLDYINKLFDVLDIKFVDNVVVLIVYLAKKPINSIYVYGLIDDIIKVKNARRFNNYYKKHPNLLFDMINLVMAEKYPRGDWHFYKEFDLSELPITTHSAFANYSFPDELRTVKFPDFLKNKKFVDNIYEIISSAHELTKQKLRKTRKDKK